MKEYNFKSDLSPEEINDRLENLRTNPVIMTSKDKYAEKCEVNLEYLHPERFGLSLKIWGSPGLFTLSGGKIEFAGSVTVRQGITYVTGVMQNSLNDLLKSGAVVVFLLNALIFRTKFAWAVAIAFLTEWFIKKRFPKKEQMCRFIEERLLQP